MMIMAVEAINERMTNTHGHYAPINGLKLYYEVHGGGQPLLLLHGNLSAIESSFGHIWPELARTRQVIAVEQRAHGRTADIDRPLTSQQMAKDTLALLDYLGLDTVDIFGYSNGSVIALQIAIDHPDRVGKLILMAVSYKLDGLHPALLENIQNLKPEYLEGTKWQQDYARIAPHPENWPMLLKKIQQMDGTLPEWTDDDIRAISSPTLIIAGDNDIIRPEHTVGMFKLLGGGVLRLDGSVCPSQLAVLPGTSHEMLVDRGDWVASMATNFLNLPIKA